MSSKFYIGKKLEPTNWIYNVKLCALGILGVGLVFVTFFQTSPGFAEILPTYWTFAVSIVLFFSAYFANQRYRPPHFEAQLVLAFFTRLFFSIGIIDLLVDGGVEFLYFEF